MHTYVVKTFINTHLTYIFVIYRHTCIYIYNVYSLYIMYIHIQIIWYYT